MPWKVYPRNATTKDRATTPILRFIKILSVELTVRIEPKQIGV